jgi:phospholipase/carboxylesterase
MIHVNNAVVSAGALLVNATYAMVMVHGRGSNPQGILAITSHLAHPEFAFLAPTASNNTWYPQRFLAPRKANEPYLSDALQTVGNTVELVKEAGIPYERIFLLGFSQGACLALEYAIRHPQRYAGVVGLSGALIGADDELTGYEDTLKDTPVFLGCSDIDDHIPVERVHLTEQLFTQQGAVVDKRIYPNFGHTINLDEIETIKAMMK